MPKPIWNKSGRLRAFAAMAACGVLAACGQSDTDPGPGGVTVGEARALDEAAAMLDEQRLPAEALEEPEQQPGAGTETETARPDEPGGQTAQ